MAPEKPTWTRRTVSRAGVELAVFEAGNRAGPTVVLVHGWPNTHSIWDGVAALLARRSSQGPTKQAREGAGGGASADGAASV